MKAQLNGGEKTIYRPINPKAVTRNELYGFLHPQVGGAGPAALAPSPAGPASIPSLPAGLALPRSLPPSLSALR